MKSFGNLFSYFPLAWHQNGRESKAKEAGTALTILLSGKNHFNHWKKLYIEILMSFMIVSVNVSLFS